MPSVTKILFRRGLDSQREAVVLNQGEPGYSTDTKRLYVGDGVTAGGTPAGIFNYGAIAALSGNYTFGSTQTNMTQSAFNVLSSANVGDIVYDLTSTSLWAVSSTSSVAGTSVPLLSDFSHLYSTTSIEGSQFYYNGPKLTISNSGVGINQIATSITAGSQALSGGGGYVIDVKPKAITNNLINPGSTNSVKITDNSGSITDVIVGSNQILGRTNVTGSVLGAVNITSTGSITLSSNSNTIQFNAPVGLPQSGGFLTGTLSALNVYNGKFVTDVVPTGSNDIINLAYARTLSAGLITPVYLSSNYYPLSGGTLNGSLSSTSYLQATNGFYSTNNYTGSYTDGIVVDYVTGNGRISVGANDAITLYNGGLASTALLTLAPGGNVGIGTTNPVASLHINQTNYGAIQLGNNVNGQGFTISKEADNSFNIWTNVFGSGTNRLKIDQSGNITMANNGGYVGIGTTAPASPLHVANGQLGTTASNTLDLARFTDFDSNANILRIYQNRFASGTNWTTAETRLQLTTDVTPQSYISFSPDGAGGLSFGTGTPASESVRITNGNVGIGTTTPGYKLDVSGSAHASRLYADNTPVAANELARKDYVDTLATPAGTVMFFAGTTAPAGWIKANGAVLPQGSYPALFAALPKQANGNTIWWVANDGATNFRLPDLRGQFIRGWNDGIAASNAGSNTLTIPTTDAGRSFGDIQADAFRSHNHSINDPGHTHTYIYRASTAVQSGNSTPCWYNTSTQNTGSSTTGITINANGGTETRPTNIALLACIKY